MWMLSSGQSYEQTSYKQILEQMDKIYWLWNLVHNENKKNM